MPRGGKKTKNPNKAFARTSSSSGDVTLYDFANTGLQAGKTRIKKAAANPFVDAAVKQMNSVSLREDLHVDWFDRDFSEAEEEFSPKSTQGNLCSSGSRNRRAKRRSAAEAAQAEADTGKTYPIDIWYIIATYIPPEDVGRFAGICKDTLEIVQSTKFWSRLYKRYYTEIKGEGLPARLQPESMERMHGFKTCVVRSLYYLYPLFVERQRSRLSKEPHTLVRRDCTMLWHQKGRGVYHFFFKMRERSDFWESNCQRSKRKPDLIETLGDMDANIEKGCKVFQVSCRAPASVSPFVLGQTLLGVSSNLSADLRSHCLRLMFGPPHVGGRQGKVQFSFIPEGAMVVSIDSVVRMKVLDWWSPSYPNAIERPKSSSDITGSPPVDDFF